MVDNSFESPLTFHDDLLFIQTYLRAGKTSEDVKYFFQKQFPNVVIKELPAIMVDASIQFKILNNLDVSTILTAEAIKEFQLFTYATLTKGLDHITDVTADLDYQRLYSQFWGMRYMRKDRKAKYFQVFQETRANKESLDFAAILHKVQNATGREEAVFTSKMMATINPDKPIMDQNVRKALNIPRKTDAIEAYRIIESAFDEFHGSDKEQDIVRAWSEKLPDYADISPTKILDYLLWWVGR